MAAARGEEGDGCESRHRLDLSEQVTVFVTTVGAPSFGECLERLRRQDCAFRLEVIDRVAPMSAAFQRMLERCRTPYYVQVDEDMLLYPHAVRTLYERIRQAEDHVALCVYPLYDVHLERCLLGVKIFRHEIVRNYPLRNVEGCEWDQLRRLVSDGYIRTEAPAATATRHSPETLGLHGTHWTPRSIYERFATLERKRCRGNATHDWLTPYAHVLLDRFLATRSRLDFFALMGVLSGTLANHEGSGREKDYRRYDKLPGFASLCRFLDEVGSDDPEVGW